MGQWGATTPRTKSSPSRASTLTPPPRLPDKCLLGISHQRNTPFRMSNAAQKRAGQRPSPAGAGTQTRSISLGESAPAPPLPALAGLHASKNSSGSGRNNPVQKDPVLPENGSARACTKAPHRAANPDGPCSPHPFSWRPREAQLVRGRAAVRSAGSEGRVTQQTEPPLSRWNHHAAAASRGGPAAAPSRSWGQDHPLPGA